MTESPSTRSLGSLPDIATVRRVSQSIAMLEAILSPEWEQRYYSFNAGWAPHEQMASMRNGAGDEYFIWFAAAGAAMKGFDHEAPMTPYRVDPPKLWPGIYDGMPRGFDAFLREPAFSMDDATFCIWRTPQDSAWHCGVTEFPDEEDPDGSEWMFAILDGLPTTYHSFAQEYYEMEVALDPVAHIYAHATLTDALVAALNPELCAADVAADAREIGYPAA